MKNNDGEEDTTIIHQGAMIPTIIFAAYFDICPSTTNQTNIRIIESFEEGNRRVSLALNHVDVIFEQIFGPKRRPRYQNDCQISPVTNVRSDKAESTTVRSSCFKHLR